LQEGWDAPAPCVLNPEGTKGDPCCDDGAETIVDTKEGGACTSVRRVGDLTDEQRRGETGERETKAEETTSGDEHTDRLRSSLKDRSSLHDAETEEEASTTPLPVRKVGREKETRDTADRLDSVKEAECGACRAAKVVAPCGDRLQGVHHRTVKPVVRLSEAEECHDEIEQAQPSLVPCRIAPLKKLVEL